LPRAALIFCKFVYVARAGRSGKLLLTGANFSQGFSDWGRELLLGEAHDFAAMIEWSSPA
jgi:hypothetical protein